LSNDVLQKILNIADELLSALGQLISVMKTEIIMIQPRSEEKTDLLLIFVRGQQLQNRLSCIYIGSMISVPAPLTAKNRIKLFSRIAKFHQTQITRFCRFSLYLKHFMALKLGMF